MSPTRTVLLALAAASILAACAEQQRPFHFSIPRGTDVDNSFEATARALTDLGHPPAAEQRRGGILTTRWEQTGFGYGFVRGQPATLVKRFLVTVAPTPAGHDVTVRMDLKRCVADAVVTETEVKGDCEQVDGILDAQQREVDVLGPALSRALASPR